MRAGQIVGGRYRLEERLGSGGHGEVWRASDLQLDDRPVALKRALIGGDATAAAKIRREAGILASINHPNVVTVYDTFHDDDQWIVMEYVSGRSLSETGTVTADQAARFGAQLAGGLEAAHAIGVLHRDIKPANVMITDQGFAKLADFGISRNVHADATLTGTGAVTGTPGYVAPEVVRGGGSTAESDVFSLGATLYYAVEGTSPFGDDNGHALLLRTAQDQKIPPRRAGALAPMLDRMLNADPRQRPGPGRARQELGTLSGDPTIGVGLAPARRRTSAWIVSAVAVLAVLTVAALGAWRYLGPEDAAFEPPDASGAAGTDMLGDPVTLDPCALLDAEALAELGDAWLAADRGTFSRCNAIVTDADGSEVVLELLIMRTTAAPDPGETEQVGRIGVIRHEPEPEECERTLALPDGEHFISLDAEQHRGGDADLCGVLEVAVDAATAVLNDGQVPRLATEPDEASLIHVDACGLLDNEALELFPGVDATHPVVAFGEWDCTWHSTTSGQNLRVLFERTQPLTVDEGEEELTIGGRQAFLQGDRWGDDSCLVSVVHLERPSPDPDRTTTSEVVRILVEGDDEPLDALCDQALVLAEPLAAALPAV